jgi:hypothetical protein
MTVRNKGVKTQRTSGTLGRTTPNKDAVSLLVVNGYAVSGGVQLNTVYKLLSMADVAALKINADYDKDQQIVLYKHLLDAFTFNPNLELYLFVCPQQVGSTHITPDVMCDKANAYVKKAIDDTKTIFNATVKLLAVAFNGLYDDYTPTITGGIDATGALAKAKLKELLDLYEDNYQYINAALEARSFNGVYANLVAVEALSSNLAAPRIRFVIASDSAYTSNFEYDPGWASVGAELGMMSKAAISENYGNPIPKFNLTDVANGLYLKPSLSGGVALSTDIAQLNSLEAKGYIFCEPVEGADGLYFNDTRTCVASDDDYFSVEYNRVVDKVLSLVRKASLPLTTNARLVVDTATGEISLGTKTMIEGACEEALAILLKDGDISGGIECVIPSGINVLAGDELFINVSYVPIAISRKVTIKAGMNNPFNKQ